MARNGRKPSKCQSHPESRVFRMAVWAARNQPLHGLFCEDRHRLLRARPVAVCPPVELKQIIIARAFDLLEAQNFRVRKTPLLRHRTDQLKNLLRFRRPLGQLRVRVVGNELQMEAIRWIVPMPLSLCLPVLGQIVFFGIPLLRVEEAVVAFVQERQHR